MAKSATAQMAEGVGAIKSWPQRIKGFYTDVRMEMKKVTTPSWKEVRATTIVVIITVALFGAYFFVIDTAIGKAVNLLFSRFVR